MAPRHVAATFAAQPAKLRLVLDHCVRSSHLEVQAAARALVQDVFRGAGGTSSEAAAPGRPEPMGSPTSALLAELRAVVGSRVQYCLEQAAVADMLREGVASLIVLYGKVAVEGAGEGPAGT